MIKILKNDKNTQRKVDHENANKSNSNSKSKQNKKKRTRTNSILKLRNNGNVHHKKDKKAKKEKKEKNGNPLWFIDSVQIEKWTMEQCKLYLTAMDISFQMNKDRIYYQRLCITHV